MCQERVAAVYDGCSMVFDVLFAYLFIAFSVSANELKSIVAVLLTIHYQQPSEWSTTFVL